MLGTRREARQTVSLGVRTLWATVLNDSLARGRSKGYGRMDSNRMHWAGKNGDKIISNGQGTLNCSIKDQISPQDIMAQLSNVKDRMYPSID